MTEHVHEWRFAPNIEKVSAAKTNTYGFFCIASEECQEYILLTEAERRLNATERLKKLIADLQDANDGPNEMGGPFVALSTIASALERRDDG